jgi:transposase
VEGILAYFNTGLTSAAIEAVNGVIPLAKRTDRAFKNLSISAQPRWSP